MDSIIQIFRMSEIHYETRIKIMKKLGIAINYQLGSNITEPLIYELVLALDPDDDIQNDEHYTRFVKN